LFFTKDEKTFVNAKQLIGKTALILKIKTPVIFRLQSKRLEKSQQN
jgi:hypothetical protein